ncbi:dethiobiotin synthase [Azospirillum sp.]|uniref:dethiobiotin synthase n=1 Tax=Azospirillum sp. TaxID=34012 RepID=UPI002D381C07|nr:dethiobiotin synthase [Azospirillum sp.]HYD63932.1 dethiobiotin synthase [Azospirillum sp.]
MKGVFVTGTDTGIGKTFVAACLVRAWRADYWKPVQTGLNEDEGDTITVGRLAEAAPERLHPPAHALQEPLSPHLAAGREGVSLSLDDFKPPRTSAPLVVEGAGGLLVPLNDDAFIIDLIAHLRLPVVLVARSTLGTINHTLLSLEALKRRDLPVAGVVMNGPANADNRAAIEHFGGVRVLAEVPPMTATPESVAEVAVKLPAFESLFS